jgi:cobalt/nickel transport system permease protein
MTILLAVHIADGVLQSEWELVGFALSGLLLVWSAWNVQEEEISRVGVFTAAFFVASQVHLPLGGASVHLLLNGLVAVVLGRRAALAIAVGLGLQGFLFAHGGIFTLGVNIWNYAAPAVLGGVLFRVIRRTKRVPDFLLGFALGFSVGLMTVALTALSLWLCGRNLGNVFPWVVFAANLPVVLVEAVGVGVIVQYLGKVKPEWLGYDSSGNTSSNGTSH